MTPAVALSQAALEPSVAYAATTEKANLDADTKIPKSETPGTGVVDASGWSNVDITYTKPSYTYVYNALDQGPTVSDATIKVTYSYYKNEGDTTLSTIEYTVDDTLKKVAYDTATASTGGGGEVVTAAEGGSAHAAAGNYTATYSVETPATAESETPAAPAATRDTDTTTPPVNSVAGAVNFITTEFGRVDTDQKPFTITKAQIKASNISLATGYVGASTPTTLAANTTAKINLSGNSVVDLYDPKKAAAANILTITYANPKDGTASTPYTKAGEVGVTVTLNSGETAGNHNNYMLVNDAGVEQTAGLELSTDIVAAPAYKGVFEDATDLVASSDGQSATIPWEADPTALAPKIKDGISVTIPGVDNTPVTSGWTPTYFYAADNKPVVDDEGQATTPFKPGKYKVNVAMDGAATPFAVLDLTVAGTLSDTSSDIVAKYNGALITATPINLTWNTDLTNDERQADVLSQLQAGFKAYLNNGGSPEVEVDAAKDLKFTVSNPANDTKAQGQITVSGSGNGVFVGTQTINFKYGTDLPKGFSLKKTSEPYAGPDETASTPDGYKVEDLLNVPQVPASGGSAKPGEMTDFTAYSVSVTYVDEKGKTVEVPGGKAAVLTKATTYDIVITGTGTYVGTVPLKFTITPLKMAIDTNVSWVGNSSNVSLNEATKTWYTAFTGTALEPVPAIRAKFNSNDNFTDFKSSASVKEGEPYDYDITWVNNENVGTAKAVLTFTGNYTGTVEIPFDITQAALNGTNTAISADNWVAADFNKGDEALNEADVLNPQVSYTNLAGKTVELVKGKDYTIGEVTKGATTYTFEVKGIGNYSGTAKGQFVTTNQDISKLWKAEVDKGDYVYKMGQEVKADVTVKTQQGGAAVAEEGNYKLVYENDTNAGTATVKVVGVGGYAGSIPLTYEIAPLQISQKSVASIKTTAPAAGYPFEAGKAFEPEVVWNTSTITPDNYKGDPIPLNQLVNDLTVTYANNDKAGTAQLIVSGKEGGNVTGTYAVDFAINPADITKAAVEAVAVAPGAPASDAVKVTLGDAVLVAGTDYTVAATGAAPGKVKATVTGTGNYAGTVEKDVEVLYDVAKADVAVSNAVYTGSAQAPKVEVSYMADGKKVVVPADAYTVTGADGATNAGTYKVTVTGKASAGWTNSVEKSFVIEPAAVTAEPQVTYTEAGAYKVTVPGLTEGKDFKVTPDPAHKKLVITYTGNYAGSATVDYKPAAKPVTPAQPAAGKTGWVGSGNDWAYYENGVQVKGGWELIDGAWYHFEANGKMTTATKSNPWFQDEDGTWYMLDYRHDGQYGAMLTGWQKDGGEWYHFAKSGAMQSGWMKDADGTWYLLNSKHDGTFGAMLTGWQKVGGKWYYMDASGAMAENEWVGRYWVDGSGVWTATR
ncbi:hypothetical protein GMI70_03990 [Eggerthellaceae bacterium zg-893]|nr:hypothetical protein [Eggerthellaceae bacterium zg-893]